MSREYAEGFMDKCAERGIDPEELLKLSQQQQYDKGLRSMPGVAAVKGYRGATGSVGDKMRAGGGAFLSASKGVARGATELAGIGAAGMGGAAGSSGGLVGSMNPIKRVGSSYRAMGRAAHNAFNAPVTGGIGAK